MQKIPKSEPRILLWDLETTHLKADFGTILCAGFRWLGEKEVFVPAISDYSGWKKEPWNDKRLVKEFSEILASADIWVTYYGKLFDVPYMQTKLLEHNLPLLPPKPHVDLYFVVKSNTTLSRKRLDNVARHLKLKSQKTPVIGDGWKKAMCGDEKSIKYVVDHCIADVKILEEAYMRLRPLVRQHPRTSLSTLCATCGGNDVQRRGTRIQGKRLVQQFCCNSCGSWGHV